MFAVSKSFPLSLAMLFVLGAADNISVVIRATVLQLLTPDSMRGRVTAVDSIVDTATRNVRVRATFDNEDRILRPGMFVEASVQMGEGAEHVTVPASAISYAPYGDSVFVVEDLAGPDGKSYRGVKQQFVELGPARGDQVAVVSGIEPGAEVVTSGVFKLRNGAAVQVNNQIQPANDPAPAARKRRRR